MASAATPFPAPGPGLRATLIPWPAGREIHRVHDSAFRSTQFNSGGKGNARFSPIATAAGKVIPTLYGGSTFDCAAMETVFHDIPFAPGFKAFDKDKLTGKCVSVISPSRDLRLVNLSNLALRKLGIARVHLIESDAADYPLTRPWAAALYEQVSQADGLYWVSRQNDEARAVVVFGDRVKEAEFDEIVPPTQIVADPVYYGQLLDLALQIDLNFV